MCELLFVSLNVWCSLVNTDNEWFKVILKWLNLGGRALASKSLFLTMQTKSYSSPFIAIGLFPDPISKLLSLSYKRGQERDKEKKKSKALELLKYK